MRGPPLSKEHQRGKLRLRLRLRLRLCLRLRLRLRLGLLRRLRLRLGGSLLSFMHLLQLCHLLAQLIFRGLHCRDRAGFELAQLIKDLLPRLQIQCVSVLRRASCERVNNVCGLLARLHHDLPHSIDVQLDVLQLADAWRLLA